MNAPPGREVIDDAGDHEEILKAEGSQRAAEREDAGDARDRGVEHGDAGEEHQPLVRLRALAGEKAGANEDRENRDAEEGQDKEGARIEARRRVIAADGSDCGRHAQDHHEDSEAEAREAEKPMNIRPAIGDERRLGEQDQIPAREGCAVNMEQRAQRRRIGEDLEEESRREADEDSGGHGGRHADVENLVFTCS